MRGGGRQRVQCRRIRRWQIERWEVDWDMDFRLNLLYFIYFLRKGGSNQSPWPTDGRGHAFVLDGPTTRSPLHAHHHIMTHGIVWKSRLLIFDMHVRRASSKAYLESRLVGNACAVRYSTAWFCEIGLSPCGATMEMYGLLTETPDLCPK